MTKTNYILAAALCVATAIALVATLGTRARSRDASYSSGQLAEEMRSLADAQAAMLARLERLESGGTSGIAPGSPAGGSGIHDANPAGVAPNQGASSGRSEDAIRAQDLAFRGEPVAGKWSLESERSIYAALDPAALARMKLEPPSEVEASCRSRTCKVELQFLDDTAADQTSVHMLQAIATTLPSAQVFYKPGPGGATSMLVYAQTAGGSGAIQGANRGPGR